MRLLKASKWPGLYNLRVVFYHTVRANGPFPLVSTHSQWWVDTNSLKYYMKKNTFKLNILVLLILVNKINIVRNVVGCSVKPFFSLHWNNNLLKTPQTPTKIKSYKNILSYFIKRVDPMEVVILQRNILIFTKLCRHMGYNHLVVISRNFFTFYKVTIL